MIELVKMYGAQQSFEVGAKAYAFLMTNSQALGWMVQDVDTDVIVMTEAYLKWQCANGPKPDWITHAGL